MKLQKPLKKRKSIKDRKKQKTSLGTFFGGFWKKEKEKKEISNITFKTFKKNVT